jgi:hypothetical protein
VGASRACHLIRARVRSSSPVRCRPAGPCRLAGTGAASQWRKRTDEGGGGSQNLVLASVGDGEVAEKRINGGVRGLAGGEGERRREKRRHLTYTRTPHVSIFISAFLFSSARHVAKTVVQNQLGGGG